MAKRKSRAKKPTHTVTKMKLSRRKQRAKSAAEKHASIQPGPAKSISAEVAVMSTGYTGAKAYEACVVLGAGTPTCAAGKSARAAMASAFSKTGTKVRKAAGGFSGLRRRRRR